MEELDFIFAKGKLSADMQARQPSLNTRRFIRIVNGRHPLLTSENPVPLNVEFGGKTQGVIITGPNTGGKTVALKTVGLLSVMACCGLHIPCEEADLAMNADIFCDIGDGQSISENLSTFSAHIKNIIRILQKADRESLVLLDELGSVSYTHLAANPDLTLEMNQMEIAYRNEILQKYVQLQKADGQVFSEDNGIVTKIKISSGERVPDGASVVLADLDESFKFRTTLTREEKKYVDINDTVSLKLGNSGRTVEGQVAYLAESESTPGSYDAIVYLPPGEGAVGQSGTMTASSQSQSYPLTIPAKAVYTDNGISYVFVLRKQQGILGEELAASRVNVNVLDKNNKFASIEEGTIDADTEIIVDTTKALEEGAVVRYGSRKE